jgi:hypothetical protein
MNICVCTYVYMYLMEIITKNSSDGLRNTMNSDISSYFDISLFFLRQAGKENDKVYR